MADAINRNNTMFFLDYSYCFYYSNPFLSLVLTYLLCETYTTSRKIFSLLITFGHSKTSYFKLTE